MVTGARVSGLADDPDFIKSVGARKLENNRGKLKITDEPEEHYDPNLTVVKVGEIDYLDPKNDDFFAPLDKPRW